MTSLTPAIGVPRNAGQFGVEQAKKSGTFKTDAAMHKMVSKAVNVKDRSTKRLASFMKTAEVFHVTAQLHAGGTGRANGTGVDPAPHYTVQSRKLNNDGGTDRLTAHVYTKNIKGKDVVTKIKT